ncbi:hypothetical protein SAMN06295879_0790 [Agreia bicolorata]|uniref:Uncharacterized protein n=1 Tax=Agreia bicolorata TaxID=110935 RepID=A0A1T4X921_9MICO|nr:hypothetical protein [Agreia bicolorata]SKA85608.1 hypothetical protein SAMN06295879_0790 [Agreia bicolorata]
MVNEYDAGAATAELRLKYGLAQGSMLKLLRANRAVMRQQGLMADQEKAAVRLYESGLSVGAVRCCENMTVLLLFRRQFTKCEVPAGTVP